MTERTPELAEAAYGEAMNDMHALVAEAALAVGRCGERRAALDIAERLIHTPAWDRMMLCSVLGVSVVHRVSDSDLRTKIKSYVDALRAGTVDDVAPVAIAATLQLILLGVHDPRPTPVPLAEAGPNGYFEEPQ